MSARAPRRRFATPFVVTLAAIPACTTTPAPAPIHANPPPPPAPEPDPSAAQEPPTAPTVVSNPPRPTAGPPDAPPEPRPDPSAPAPAVADRRWTVFKVKGQDGCSAFANDACPKVPPGQPIPPCNPPPPIAYACLPGMKDGESVRIVMRRGSSECLVDMGPIHCRPNATCNPPPPRKVPCPKR